MTVRTQVGEFFFAHTPMNKIVAAQENIFEPLIPVEKISEHFDIEILDKGGRLVEARQKFGEAFKLTRWKYDLNDNCIERREWQDLQTRQSATNTTRKTD